MPCNSQAINWITNSSPSNASCEGHHACELLPNSSIQLWMPKSWRNSRYSSRGWPSWSCSVVHSFNLSYSSGIGRGFDGVPREPFIFKLLDEQGRHFSFSRVSKAFSRRWGKTKNLARLFVFSLHEQTASRSWKMCDLEIIIYVSFLWLKWSKYI